jgi:hypothetical protein
MFVEQLTPEYPEAHVHRYAFAFIDASVFESEHVAPFLQGPDAHSSVSIWHVVPV